MIFVSCCRLKMDFKMPRESKHMNPPTGWELLSFSSLCKFTLSVLYLSLCFSPSPPQSLCLCSVLLFSLGCWGKHNCIFLYINSCTLNTIQLLTKTHVSVGWSFLPESISSCKSTICLFACSVLPVFSLPLCWSVSYFEPRPQTLTGTADFLLFSFLFRWHCMNLSCKTFSAPTRWC